MERLTCNELKTIRDGFFIHKGNRKDGAKYRMLAESSPKYEEIYRKLAEYEDAEEQGLLLRLPCKAGSTLYQPINSHVNEYKVIGLCFDVFQNKWMYEVAYEVVGVWNKTICDFEVIGKTVFLTKEEVELELEKMKQSHAEVIMDERNGR